jgi:hypothetical protein
MRNYNKTATPIRWTYLHTLTEILNAGKLRIAIKAARLLESLPVGVQAS